MVDWEVFRIIFLTIPLTFVLHATPPVLLFCYSLQKKEHFLRNILLAPVFFFLYSLLVTFVILSVFQNNAGISGLYLLYLLMFLGIFLLECILFQGSFSALLFNLLGGFALYQIGMLIFSFFYPATLYVQWAPGSLAYNLVLTVWLAIIYILSYRFIIRRPGMAADEDIFSGGAALYFSIAMSLFLIYFNLVRNAYADTKSLLDSMCLICLILFYSSILMVRRGLLSVLQSKKELALMERVWKEKEKSLMLTADAANAVNIKYHDLKKLLSKLNPAETADLSAEISKALTAYEHTVSTGNDTLDLILAEQSLRFAQNDIAFSCIADGTALAFMHSLDIIALFTNALDNAFEAVLPLEKSKREIYFAVKRAMGMVSICVENLSETKPAFQNGLPATTKKDTAYHGFGMKSIRMTVEKYGGELSATWADSLFSLKIILPEP